MSAAVENGPTVSGVGEEEPLLGRAGDASQQDGKPLQYNLILGMTTAMTIYSRFFRAKTFVRHSCCRAGRRLGGTLLGFGILHQIIVLTRGS